MHNHTKGFVFQNPVSKVNFGALQEQLSAADVMGPKETPTYSLLFPFPNKTCMEPESPVLILQSLA